MPRRLKIRFPLLIDDESARKILKIANTTPG
jgi:hypothetical protein